MYSPSWAGTRASRRSTGLDGTTSTRFRASRCHALGKAIFADDRCFYAGLQKRRHADERVRDS